MKFKKVCFVECFIYLCLYVFVNTEQHGYQVRVVLYREVSSVEKYYIFNVDMDKSEILFLRAIKSIFVSVQPNRFCMQSLIFLSFNYKYYSF